MPDLRENLSQWEADYSWAGQGDEWSGPWGGTDLMWWGVLRPRVHAFLPAARILEIAPGFGRWTHFLKDLCEQLVAVDMSERCIDACRKRFAADDNIIYHVNDGRSLQMVADGSIDFAFSFDSLVHAEAEVLAEYLTQLAKKLTPDGIGFIHHSNMGAYRTRARIARRIPEGLRRRLVLRGICVNIYAWRAESVTADLVARWCNDTRLRCLSQELINWQCGRQLIDCITVVTPEGSRWSREARRLENHDFMRDAAGLTRLSALYAAHNFPGTGSSSPL